MRVPFFDMQAELAAVRGDVDAAIARVLASGTFIGGTEVAAFEQELAAALGVRHAIGVSSGTDALHVLGMALRVAPGDEIVTSPFTFFATAGAFARLGARVVFADIDDHTLCLDPHAALAACSRATRAIVSVNLFGRPAELPDGAPCAVIEDAAQSIGSGAPRGLASTLSFFPTKNLGALGDAGAVITDDPDLATKVALLRQHGALPKYHHIMLGGNFRLDEVQAAVLRAKLPHLPDWTAARRSHARHYRELFSAARVPPELQLPSEHPEHVYHQFVIRTPRRDELRSYLSAQGIGTEVYYPEALHRQPCLGVDAGVLKHAERATREVLALPLHPTMLTQGRERVVDAVARFFV